MKDNKAGGHVLTTKIRKMCQNEFRSACPSLDGELSAFYSFHLYQVEKSYGHLIFQMRKKLNRLSKLLMVIQLITDKTGLEPRPVPFPNCST